MERLTARNKKGLAYMKKVKPDEQEVNSAYPNTLKAIFEGMQRLADYEDAGLTPEEIMDGKMLTGWIPVDERLPEDESCVLVCAIDNSDGEKEIAISAYIEVVFGGQKLGYKLWTEPYQYFFRNHEITHWMPLPQPPKGEE